MTKKETARGFTFYEFKDSGGESCNIQKSSRAGEDYIWFGSTETGLKGFIPCVGWQEVSDKQIKEKFGFQDIITNNRMHLSREQVRELMPILQKFVKTGEI